MLKGRANYLCTRRLQKAMQQSGNLFTSSEGEELKRIYEWSQTTKDGSLSDFDDIAAWIKKYGARFAQSAAFSCSPKICGYQSDFSKDHPVCFFQRARNKILSSDVLVLNHTLFFTLLGGLSEEQEGGILFKNDFVIFDEAHTMESVASKHIGLSVSSGQVRYALNRLWNPRTEKGLLATLRQGASVKLVADLMSQADEFFANVESACEEIQKSAKQKSFGSGERRRDWTELRIRRAELVADNVTLPLQRLRESVSDLIKTSEDKDIGQELLECNRRLAELKEEVVMFLGQTAEEYVYWVERSGKSQRNLALNAAPVDVAEYLRRRLFQSDTSVIMTSATLATTVGQASSLSPSKKEQRDNPEPVKNPVIPFIPFDPALAVGKMGRHLPHWKQDGCTYFVTFRLADSIPHEKQLQWQMEQREWLEQHPEPRTSEQEEEYAELFAARFQKWLDEGQGECWLKKAELSTIVEKALRFFDGERYWLGHFVVMPNHVHVLVRPLGEHDLSSILHSWKSFTASKINSALKREGKVWQDESFGLHRPESGRSSNNSHDTSRKTQSRQS